MIKYAKDKPIIFSSFHPDAAVLMKKLQTFYPVRSIHIYICIELMDSRIQNLFFDLIYLGVLDN